MALSISPTPESEAGSASTQCTKPVGRNDAFTFWKLPVEFRTRLRGSIAASERIARAYLFEEYLSERERRPSTKLAFYYLIKSFIPVAARHRLNSIAVRARKRLDFPHWPQETALVDFWKDWIRQSLATLGIADAPHIAFWPNGYKTCIVLTHDVESPFGVDHIERMTDIEEKHGFRSALNFPLNQYQIDWRKLEGLRRRGFEFGAHGLAHDGRLFRSEEDFRELAPMLERFAQEHGFRGFRSPSTLRRAEWIERLNFDLDSSYADTDPYEPQPGGSCSIFPFFLGRVVELPYTVPQDHTLIHVLRRDPLPIWTSKVDWIASNGGMILTITHPDYSGVEPHLSQYEELLKRLKDIECAWRALPSEAADWWRQRSQMQLNLDERRPVISGPGSERAVIRRLSDEPMAR